MTRRSLFAAVAGIAGGGTEAPQAAVDAWRWSRSIRASSITIAMNDPAQFAEQTRRILREILDKSLAPVTFDPQIAGRCQDALIQLEGGAP